jgi:hypothetical protein
VCTSLDWPHPYVGTIKANSELNFAISSLRGLAIWRRKFHPVGIRAVRQNHRIVRVDAFGGANCLTVRQFLATQRGGRRRKGGIRAAARVLGLTRHRLGPHHRGLYKGCSGEHTYCPHSTRGTMAPFKPKPRQPPMTKAELRAQGIQALAQVTTPIIKLPMKIRRQCGHCGDFNSVLVEPGQAVPAFKCLACGYAAG